MESPTSEKFIRSNKSALSKSIVGMPKSISMLLELSALKVVEDWFDKSFSKLLWSTSHEIPGASDNNSEFLSSEILYLN